MKCLYPFLLWLCMIGAAQAQPATLPSQTRPPPLALSADVSHVSGSGALSLFRTTADEDDPERISRMAAWQPMSGELGLGYSLDYIWLKFSVARAASAPGDWVLNFGNALIDDVLVFYRRSDGSWMRLRAGENINRDIWPLDVRNTSFPLALPPGETTLLIRIQSKNALTSAVYLWQRDAFDNQSRKESLYYGLYFGGFLLLMILHGFFWRMTKEKQSGWYLLYLMLTAIVQMLTLGIPQWILRLPVELSDPLLGCSICLGLIVGTQFAILQLKLKPVYPRVGKFFMYGIIVVSLLSAGLIVAGHYGQGATLIQLATLVEMVVMMGFGVHLLFKGYPPARFFVFVFGTYYITIGISFLRNLTIFPSNLFTTNVISLGTLIHILAMSMRLHFQFNVLRKRAADAQNQAMQAIRRLNEGLESEVAIRTADLQHEIERRTLLEDELRSSLATERRIQDEQRSFVAMVSHEFRTPLAIINVTAQQIARNPDATWNEVEDRCQNLRDTVRRMSDLVDNYLSADRMDMDSPVFSLRHYNIRELIDDLVQQWPPGRISARLLEVPEPFVCDPGLLKIALHNLLTNADRHAPSTETITLTAWAGPEQGLRIDVSNGGEPIPPEEVPRLFLKYFRGRLAQQRTGAGLGLHLVKQIAEMHGGTAWIENAGQYGKITFSLFIPAQEAAAP